MFTLFKYLKPILLLFLIIGFTSCYEYPELNDIQYEDYRRVIGPEGGTINFYNNYENDSLKDILVKMEFPENALDSIVVFNMYEFNDIFAANDLSNIGMNIYTNFLYFLPFYESDGYNEQTQDDIEYHLTINYNIPISIKYNINKDITNQSPYFEESILNGTSKLYRIKIPGLNEWTDNIWVNWNIQGYPEGYENIDLVYLITGRWTETFEWGYGELNLDNWEEVIFTYDNTSGSITFDAENTDYMYVMGENISKK